ncbi:hypothetical protein N866_12575 [Actinotalea ferrariae CF5-4]|uniref:DUF3618 domain-containing protein n=1 Tax=Actinotalea ferrariae CF5-4 TaxID=948458 RepID=A0A021VT10_9CELL|nr:DUF3618 domain-containing protein [Actinotalea ferrariae]EYR64319.1 hypothetical protein N866_12575 [Actinotalea ferrariae CF5-4]
MSTTSRDKIEADISRTREELRSTVDELSDRLSPKNLAQEAVDEVKIAVADLKRRATGEVRSPDEPEATRTGWILLGTGAFVALTVVQKIVRKL